MLHKAALAREEGQKQGVAPARVKQGVVTQVAVPRLPRVLRQGGAQTIKVVARAGPRVTLLSARVIARS